jgi:hypothetical protein
MSAQINPAGFSPQIWDMESGRVLATLEGHASSASTDNTLKV